MAIQTPLVLISGAFSTLPPGDTIDATKLNFLQAGASGVARTVDSKLKDTVSVKDFGAVGDGVTNDTTAFTNAVATGKAVFVPISTGGYVINNVPITTNTVIIGEKSGVYAGPSLLISQSNAAAFVPSDVTTSIFQIQIENFLVATTNTSVTNAAFYRHSDKTHYTAYFNFTNIESSTSLEVVYDGFFIFGCWEGCRDGYIGNINTNTAHCAINSIPASFSQGNQTNVNIVNACHFFGDTTVTNSASAIIDIAYGDLWTFSNCDFEGLKTTAVRLRGVGNVSFNSCWFERITASANVVADITPSNPKGSGANFIDCYGLLSNTINRFATFGTSSVGFFQTCTFVQIPPGVVLATGVVRHILNVSGNNAGGTFLSGYATAEFYLNGQAVISGGPLLVGTSSQNATGGILQLTSGITFPATAVAASDVNTLDDYEEGIFSPIVIGTVTAGTGGYSTQIGKYTKIGRLVTVEVFMDWNTHDGTGNMAFSGLPFTIPTGTASPGASLGYVSNINFTAGYYLTAYAAANSTAVILQQNPVGGGASAAVPIDTTGAVTYSLTYAV